MRRAIGNCGYSDIFESHVLVLCFEDGEENEVAGSQEVLWRLENEKKEEAAAAAADQHSANIHHRTIALFSEIKTTKLCHVR